LSADRHVFIYLHRPHTAPFNHFIHSRGTLIDSSMPSNVSDSLKPGMSWPAASRTLPAIRSHGKTPRARPHASHQLPVSSLRFANELPAKAVAAYRKCRDSLAQRRPSVLTRALMPRSSPRLGVYEFIIYYERVLAIVSPRSSKETNQTIGVSRIAIVFPDGDRDLYDTWGAMLVPCSRPGACPVVYHGARSPPRELPTHE
jgi:hypothetical protein